MLKYILPLCILIFPIQIHAQTKSKATAAIDERLKDLSLADIPAEQLLDSMIKIKKQCQDIRYDGGVIQTGRSMMIIYGNQGNTREVIKTANQIENLPAPQKYSMAFSDIHRMKGLALGKLGYDELSLKEFRTAITYAKKIEDPNFKHYKLALAYDNINAYFENTDVSQDTILHYLKKSLEETQKIDDHVSVFPVNYKYDMLCILNMNFGLFYMSIYKPQNMELAEKYFMESLKIYDSKKYNVIPANKSGVLTALGRLYFTKKDYKKAVIYSENALILEKQYKNPYDRKDAYQVLIKSYLELDNNDKSKEYLKLFTYLNDSLVSVEKESVSIPLNKIVADNKAAHDKKMQNTLLLIAGIFALLVIVSVFFWRKNNKKIHKNYNLLLEKLKLETVQPDESINSILVDENEDIDFEIDTDAKEKPIYIPNSTASSLILKLERFEKSNKYTKKEVNLVYLANYLGTNTKYLSEIIKRHKGKSFNDYINGLRVDYLTRLLFEEPKYRKYKMDYLASVCGFASRQVLNMAFKKQTGISPSFFLETLEKEIDID